MATIQALVSWRLILVYSRCMYVKDRRSIATDQKQKEANVAKLGQVINKKIGIWIDHKEAILVSIEGDQTPVARIESNAESHYRPSGGRKAGGTSVAQSVSKEQKADEHRKHQFPKFYQNEVLFFRVWG